MTLKLALLPAALLLSACDPRPATPATRAADLPIGRVQSQSLIPLGGSEQYVEITGVSDTNPVLLFIHGGPGWPQTPMLRYFNADLTRSFTLVSWDQRGAGKSFLHDSAPPDVTLEQIVADGHELTQLLKARFRKQQIYLAGFSWGSIVGVALAERYPEDYAAYIGISQMINVRRGMVITQDWIATKARAAGDTVTLKTLQRLRAGDPGLCVGGMNCFITQYELLSKYGGAVYNPASDAAVERAMKAYPDYAAYDWNKGFAFSAARLEGAVFGADLSRVTRLGVPVVLIVGRHDWNIPPALSSEWLARLDAPAKQLIWFDSSGHGPLEEQPQAFNKAMIGIIAWVR
jgi:pimeloyl-ACP methyl ester carboxylesterase